MRFTYGLFFVVLGLYVIYELLRERKLRVLNRGLALFLGFTLAITPWLIHNKLEHRKFLWNIIQQFNITEIQQVQPAMMQAVHLLKVLGPLVILVLIGLYIAVKNRDDMLLVPGVFLALHFIYTTFIVHLKLERYLLPLIPFAIIIGYYGLVKSIKKRKTRHAILLLVLLFTTGFAVIEIITLVREGHCNASGAVVQTVEYLQNNSDADDVVVSNVWPYFGYYNNLEVHSMWSSNAEKYKERYNAKHVIYHDRLGDSYDTSSLDGSKHYKPEKKISGCDGTAHIYSSS